MVSGTKNVVNTIPSKQTPEESRKEPDNPSDSNMYGNDFRERKLKVNCNVETVPLEMPLYSGGNNSPEIYIEI